MAGWVNVYCRPTVRNTAQVWSVGSLEIETIETFLWLEEILWLHRKCLFVEVCLMPQREVGWAGVSGFERDGAHLLSAREGMIEAGHVGHDGLLIWPQCAHDVYTQPSNQQQGERGPFK